MRLHESPGDAARRSPERAALLEEERAVDQALGEGHAIERDERADAHRAIMDMPREQLLPLRRKMQLAAPRSAVRLSTIMRSRRP
ncbi:hypothetical protein BE21_09065 [Sorangium cellulosum]|uniref:Uncharacterized protein n=1 Tax=Sorangium cellulosum TaxID=56 RepID=A0A150U232_SORCE|nr:hypothetical protein BE21_09065 [Sorangium cellulosum]